MSYKCSKCGLGIIVISNQTPIRVCDCKVKIERQPVGFIEKFKSLFGKKFYNEKLAAISCDIEGTAKGNSQFRNN